MSRFNHKGYKTVPARTESGEVKQMVVKSGGKYDRLNKRLVAKAKRERTLAFREYKDNLREQKKRIPLSERSKMNFSKVPERYFSE